jgi:zinc transport system substrate-binding protein
VDDAVQQVPSVHRFDAARHGADLDLRFTPIEDGERSADSGAIDPHFWLDPLRVAAVGDALAVRLAELSPHDRADFEAGARHLRDRLTELDGRLRAGLATCASREVVTSHNAFGYLARRYDLEQAGIAGLTPEEEPSPADLAAVTRFVRAHQVHTIFFEALVSPAIARSIADETGATTAVLDPIEGLTDRSRGRDYVEVMDADLDALRLALRCS